MTITLFDEFEFQRGRLVRPGQTPPRQRGVRAWLQGSEPGLTCPMTMRAGARIGTVRSPTGGGTGAGIAECAGKRVHGRPLDEREAGTRTKPGMIRLSPFMAVCARCGAAKLTEQPCPRCGGRTNAAAAWLLR